MKYAQITTRVRQQCVNTASTVRQQQIQRSVDTCVNSRISGVLTHMSASTVDMSASTLIQRAWAQSGSEVRIMFPGREGYRRKTEVPARDMRRPSGRAHRLDRLGKRDRSKD